MFACDIKKKEEEITHLKVKMAFIRMGNFLIHTRLTKGLRICKT